MTPELGGALGGGGVVQGGAQGQPGAVGQDRIHIEAPAQAAHPFADPAQSEGAGLLQVGGVDADAVVADLEEHLVAFLEQANADLRRAGVLADIGEGFLEHPEEGQGGVVVGRQVVVIAENLDLDAGALGEVLALGFDGGWQAEVLQGVPDIGAGVATVAGTVRTFTVTNSGTGNLTLGNVVVGGTHAADFAVSLQPGAAVSSGSSTAFTVTFAPKAVGQRNATLSFTNNDASENPFNFSIQGSGLNAPPTITDIPNQTINEDGNTGVLFFTVGDDLTPTSSLTVTAPARQIIRSQSARRCAMSSTKGSSSACTCCCA